MRRVVPYLALIGLLASACGGGKKEAAPPANTTCSASGTTLGITAEDLKFDKKCLAAPAGQAFTIEFVNKDGDQHNVAIYKSSKAKENLFRGATKAGPATLTYNVPALSAGRYFFRCDPHPDMTGTFIVE